MQNFLHQQVLGNAPFACYGRKASKINKSIWRDPKSRFSRFPFHYSIFGGRRQERTCWLVGFQLLMERSPSWNMKCWSAVKLNFRESAIVRGLNVNRTTKIGFIVFLMGSIWTTYYNSKKNWIRGILISTIWGDRPLGVTNRWFGPYNLPKKARSFGGWRKIVVLGPGEWVATTNVCA